MTARRLDEADALALAAETVIGRPGWADLDDRDSTDAIRVEAARLLAEQDEDEEEQR